MPDVPQAVEEEDDAEEEQQVVVAGDHVLGAEVEERHQAALLHEGAIRGRHAVGRQVRAEPEPGNGQDQRRRRESNESRCHEGSSDGVILGWP